MMEITKEEYMAYEGVRVSGVINMFNIRVIQELIDLPRDKIFQIMREYTALKKKYDN